MQVTTFQYECVGCGNPQPGKEAGRVGSNPQTADDSLCGGGSSQGAGVGGRGTFGAIGRAAATRL